MDHIVEILKALSDQSRYTIVTLLLRREYCVGALTKRVGISEAAVSQHLKILRRAGIVRGEKRGYFTHYQVDRELLKAVANELVELAGQISRDESRCSGENHGSQCDKSREEGAQDE